MRILVQVNDGPRSATSVAALDFVRGAVAAGHQVLRVFFYHEGVRHGSPAAAGEPAVSAWSELARSAELDLVCCSAAAERRGLYDPDVQSADVAGGQAGGFRVAGLGQWMDAVAESDRVVRFGHGVAE